MVEYQPCRYKCGKKLAWRGKDPEIERDTGWRELDDNGHVTDIPHTYKRCEEIKKATAKKELEKQEELKHVEEVKQAHGGGLEAFSS